MTIEQCPDYSAVEHSRKCLMMRLRMPFRHDLIALGEAIDVQSFLIRRPTPEADAIG